MIRSDQYAKVSAAGSFRSVTDSPSEAQNDPVGNWMPGIYDRRPVTDSGQGLRTEEELWADLAASAREDWAAENPF